MPLSTDTPNHEARRLLRLQHRFVVMRGRALGDDAVVYPNLCSHTHALPVRHVARSFGIMLLAPTELVA